MFISGYKNINRSRVAAYITKFSMSYFKAQVSNVKGNNTVADRGRS
jgi:hypothetical protein